MMIYLFEECVNDIVALVRKQREEVMKQYDDQGVAEIKVS